MDILYLMIICSVSLAAVFLVIFIVSARKGQFEDDESPAVRILLDDEAKKTKEPAAADAEDGRKNDININGNTKV